LDRAIAAPTRLERAALALILVVAAGLRLAGVSHGLSRGGPAFDERNNFVDPILRMWTARSPDPTVYAGYAGFFNYLAFLPVGVGDRLAGEVGAYTAARGLGAVFGVLSVLTLYQLARAVAGAGAGLFAAALLSVSPLEVRSAHFVSPDVLVGTALLALLFLAQREGGPWDEVLAGMLLGAATAVKYTGLILAPAIGTWLLVERRPPRSALRVALAAALTFAAAAPYALLSLSDQGTGLRSGLETYYGQESDRNRFIQEGRSSFLQVVELIAAPLGPPATILAFLSVVMARARRFLLIPVAVIVSGVLVMTPANFVQPRHVLPVAAAGALLAGVGFRALTDQLPSGSLRTTGAALLSLACLLNPSVSSVRHVRRFLTTTSLERAADWIEAEIRGPALVLTSLDRLKLAPSRFEVRLAGSLLELPAGVLPWYDVIVASSRRELPALEGLEPLARFDSEEEGPERSILILRPRFVMDQTPAPRPAKISSSSDAPLAPIFDGDGLTTWTAPAGPTWIEMSWLEPTRVAGVAIEAGPGPSWPQSLQLLGTSDNEPWRRLAVEALRPTRPQRQRQGAPHGQIYVLTPPQTVSGLRIKRAEGGTWTLAGIQILSGARRGRDEPGVTSNGKSAAPR